MLNEAYFPPQGLTPALISVHYGQITPPSMRGQLPQAVLVPLFLLVGIITSQKLLAIS